jgi:hypothetical protein
MAMTFKSIIAASGVGPIHNGGDTHDLIVQSEQRKRQRIELQVFAQRWQA